jgi:hypothetical protein
MTAMDVRTVTVGVPGAVDYFDFRDPDGNNLSLYTVM